MEKTLEDSRGRCTTLWSCRDFTGQQTTIYSRPKGFENNMTCYEKCFKLNLETQLVSWGKLYFVWRHRKRQIQPVWVQMFLFGVFSGLQKMSKAHDRSPRLQEWTTNKYKLRFWCVKLSNCSISVQETVQLFKWQVDVLTVEERNKKNITFFKN